MSNKPPQKQTFEDFTAQYTSVYLKENYKDVVKAFILSENKEKNLKVKPPIIWKNILLGGFFTIDQYKSMANEAINSPLANRKGTINKMLEDYINKPLKQTTGNASKIYDNIKNNANHIFRGNKFLYYSNIIKIEELIKFEMYLLNDCKENKKRAGQKPIPKLSAEQYLLVSDDDKQRFLDKLKEKYKDEGIKEYCYLLIGLNQLNLLNTESQKNVFEVISEYFGGYYGRYSNFHKHWQNPNNIDLLERTKKQIKKIKYDNVIM